MVPSIELIRLENKHASGNFGVLRINKEVYCVTLEPPSMQNKSFVSAIPAGQYKCVKVDSPKYGKTYEVKNVPDRSHILFHAGNTSKDTAGCIILAQHYGKLMGNRAILNSGETFHKFLTILYPHQEFILTIIEVY